MDGPQLTDEAELAAEMSKMRFFNGTHDSQTPPIDLLYAPSTKLSSITPVTQASPEYKKVDSSISRLKRKASS